MDVVQHQILSLDFWQDTVSYEGKNFPSGTIGCDALNIPAALIKQITELCGSLNLFMGAMQLGMANAELFISARESALQIVHKLKDIPPFSYLDEKRITAHIQKVFSNEYLENAMAYAKSLASGNLMNALEMCIRDRLLHAHLVKGIFCRLMEQDFFLMFLPKFSVTICIDRRPDNVIMNVRLVYVSADYKGMIAFSKTLCKFYTQPVCFFRGNLTGAEGLTHMIGCLLYTSYRPPDCMSIDPKIKKKRRL